MQMLQFQIGQTFPLVLACFDNGTVALLKAREFSSIFDSPETGVHGAFHPDHFALWTPGRESLAEFEYSTQYNYKNIPLLLAWLKQQNLQPPQFKGGV